MPNTPIRPIPRPVLSREAKTKIEEALARPWRTPGPDTALDDYDLQFEIGTGTYASVWHAIRRTDHATFAIKVLLPEAFSLADDDRVNGAQDFWRGALITREFGRVAEVLGKTIAVTVQDGPSTDACFVWYAMPHIETGTLRSQLELGNLSLDERDAVATELIAALKFAHDRGLAHRDLRPENVFLDSEKHCLLSDMAVAPLGAARHGETRARGALAMRYLPPASPDALGPGWADVSSQDLYALSVILFELYAGSGAALPDDRSADGFLAALPPAEDNPEQGIEGLHPSIRRRVARFCSYGLAKEPGRRFAAIANLERGWTYLSREPAWSVWLGFAFVASIVASVCLVADWAWFRVAETSQGRWVIGAAAAGSNTITLLLGYKWWETYQKRIVGDLPAWRLALSRWLTASPSRGLLFAALTVGLPAATIGISRLPHRLEHYWVQVTDTGCDVKRADGSSTPLHPSSEDEVVQTDRVVCSKSAASFRPETLMPFWTPPDGGVTGDGGGLAVAVGIADGGAQDSSADAPEAETGVAGSATREVPPPPPPFGHATAHPQHPEAGADAPGASDRRDAAADTTAQREALCAKSKGDCIIRCPGDYASDMHARCVAACNSAYATCVSTR